MYTVIPVHTPQTLSRKTTLIRLTSINSSEKELDQVWPLNLNNLQKQCYPVKKPGLLRAFVSFCSLRLSVLDYFYPRMPGPKLRRLCHTPRT